MKYRCITICVLLFLFVNAHAQQNDSSYADVISWDFDEEDKNDFSLWTFLEDIFTPQIITDTKYIRQYIIDDRFQILRSHYGDIRALDAIYLKSLKISDHNIARALFISLMAVLEHRSVDIKIPVFSSLRIPLTFEKKRNFDARIMHLPVKIYSDSPAFPGCDRDKLQHFFASAFLSYVSEAPDFTRITGNLVEIIEDAIVVGGAEDPRDKRANRQGQSFGEDLLIVTNLLPSDYLTFRYEECK
ncbi:MAG: hypothetical protein JXA06_06545 [Bacteroidetes bacterium]|nr:hypothetical protein [Bacteroidota bacterium]